jgi:hypothetical protein
MLEHFKLGQRSVRLAVAATAFGAALAMQSAHAAVVVRDFTAAPVTIPFNVDGLYINIVSGATGFTGLTTPGWDFNAYFAGATSAAPTFNLFSTTAAGNAYVGSVGNATPLTVGTTVGAASTFVTGVLGTGPAAAGIQYYGFRFLNGDAATGTTHFGYAAFSRTLPVAAGSVRLLGYAFESTPRTSITVSPIPEPSSALLMLAGLAVAGGLMRKRLVKQA